MENDNRYPIHGIKTSKYRLKSRKSSFKNKYSDYQLRNRRKSKTLETNDARDKRKKDNINTEPREELHKGKNLPWSLWRTINRIKVACSRTKKIMRKWGLATDDRCECGEVQDDKHIFECTNFNRTCTAKDVDEMNDNAI